VSGQPTVVAGADNPQETRVCRKCSTETVVSPSTWPYHKTGRGYTAYGGVCQACETARKQDQKRRAKDLEKLGGDVPTHPIRKDDKDAEGKAAQKEALAQSRLDVARSLKIGSRTLNEYAPAVLARVLQQFEDASDPAHQWAVQFLAERILPRKLYEELGGQAAGVGSLKDQRPQFLIQVVAASPDVSAGRVIEHGQVQTVEALPAPADE
jgi:hypothetical protein